LLKKIIKTPVVIYVIFLANYRLEVLWWDFAKFGVINRLARTVRIAVMWCQEKKGTYKQN